MSEHHANVPNLKSQHMSNEDNCLLIIKNLLHIRSPLISEYSNEQNVCISSFDNVTNKCSECYVIISIVYNKL